MMLGLDVILGSQTPGCSLVLDLIGTDRKIILKFRRI